MNKTIFLLAAALSACGSLFAQDLIVKTDATQVEACVLEISPEQIRYKRFSNPDGPTYVLPVGAVDHIRYANGETESFRSALSAPQQIPAASEVPAKTEPSKPVYAALRYDIGDFYDVDGVQGVVCWVTEDKMHGLILSLDEIYLHWSEFEKNDLRTAGADDMSDGQANMEKIAAYIEANNSSWADFPAFEWCRNKGEGWYLPSINELLTIGNNYNGGIRTKFDRHSRNRFNGALKEHGGKRMDRLVYYFSSTEKDEKMAYTSHMDIEPPFVNEIPKYNKFLVRAVRRF